MATELIKLIDTNWTEVVDVIYDLFYDYLLRIEYSTVPFGKEPELNIVDDVTLSSPKRWRHDRLSHEYIMIGIYNGAKKFPEETLTLYIENCTIRYDKISGTMRIETESKVSLGIGHSSTYKIYRRSPIPAGEEHKYISLNRYTFH